MCSPFFYLVLSTCLCVCLAKDVLRRVTIGTLQEGHLLLPLPLFCLVFVLPYLLFSRLTLCYAMLCCALLSCVVLCCWSRLVLSCQVPSLVLSCPVLSFLSCLVVSCLVLSSSFPCLVLSCLSCHVFSCHLYLCVYLLYVWRYRFRCLRLFLCLVVSYLALFCLGDEFSTSQQLIAFNLSADHFTAGS
jgi:hypothetical protein